MSGKTEVKEREDGPKTGHAGAPEAHDDRFRILSEHSPVGVCIIEKHLFTYVNQAFAEMFGYAVDELVGIKGPKDMVLGHDWPSLGDLAKKGASEGNPGVRLQFRGVKKDGTLIDVELYATKTGDQKHRFLIGTVLDITDRKKAEEALHAERAKFQVLAERAPFGLLMLDADGKFAYMNPIFHEMFGYGLDEIPNGREWFRRAYPDPEYRHYAIDAWLDDIKQVKLGKKSPGTFTVRAKDGSEKIVDFTIVELVNGEHLLACLDVTDRENAQAELQAAHRNLEDIVDFLPDATFVIDNDKRVIVWNRTAEEMTGVPKDEIIGKGDSAYGVAFYGEKWPMLIDLLDAPDTDVDATYDFVSRKGKALSAELFIPSLYGGMGAYVWATASPLYDSDGNVVGAIESISDISIQKDAERQLQETEERYRIAIENSNDGVALIRGGEYIYVNRRFLEIFGYEAPEEVLGKKQLVIVHEDDRERVADIARRRARDEEVPAKYEFKGIKKDDTLLHVEVSASFVNYLGENVLLAYLKDITEQRKAEEKLLQLAAIADASDDAIFGISQNGTIISWNSGGEKIYGYTAEQMRGAPVSIILHPSKYIEVMEMVTKLKQGVHIDHFETVHIRKDGKLINVSVTMSPLTGSDGSIIGGSTIARDITRRKRTEEELQESLEKLRKTIGGIIQAMSVAVEMRDPYTAGHQKRVAGLAGMIAQEMGLSQEKREAIYMAALMHDLGKIRVPAEILSKPGQLSEIEFNMIKTHPQVGYEILKNIHFSAPIAKIILQHHELMDGSGYPNGLAGNDILIEARIISVADVVEAISSHRPYRPAFSIDNALDRIAEGRGSVYDADVVDACVRVCRERGFGFPRDNE